MGSLGARDPDAVARDRDTGNRRVAVRIEQRREAQLRVVPAMLDPGRHRQIDVGHDPLVQEQIVDRQPLGGARGAIADRFDALAAFGSQLHDARDDAHPSPYFEHQPQAFQKIARGGERRRVAPRGRAVGASGLEDRVDARAGVEILPRDQPQQRPAAGDHSGAVGHKPRGFEQNLPGAGGHHARQGPAGNGKRPLQCAGREDHALRFDDVRGAGDRDTELALAREVPHRGARHILRAAREEFLHQFRAGPVVRAQHGILFDRRCGDGAIDLPARRGLFVEQYGCKPGARTDGRGGEPGRPGADHRNVVIVAQLAHSYLVPRARRSTK